MLGKVTKRVVTRHKLSGILIHNGKVTHTGRDILSGGGKQEWADMFFKGDLHAARKFTCSEPKLLAQWFPHIKPGDDIVFKWGGARFHLGFCYIPGSDFSY